jgi:hypothetical protein
MMIVMIVALVVGAIGLIVGIVVGPGLGRTDTHGTMIHRARMVITEAAVTMVAQAVPPPAIVVNAPNQQAAHHAPNQQAAHHGHGHHQSHRFSNKTSPHQSLLTREPTGSMRASCSDLSTLSAPMKS